MRALWHPTRAQVLELVRAAPRTRSELVAATGASLGEVAYHCRALCSSCCIKHADSSGPDAADPLFEAT